MIDRAQLDGERDARQLGGDRREAGHAEDHREILDALRPADDFGVQRRCCQALLWPPGCRRMYALSDPRASASEPLARELRALARIAAARHRIRSQPTNRHDARHQPSPRRRLPAAELPDRPADQPRRLFDRLPGVRRDRRAGRDQGVPAVVAGAAHRGRHRARELGREPDVVPLRDEVLLRGRPRAREDQPPERRARAELLPRQRDGVHGDALRARPHAAAADPDAPGPDVRAASCGTCSCTC